MSCCPLLPFTAHYCCNGHNERHENADRGRECKRESENLIKSLMRLYVHVKVCICRCLVLRDWECNVWGNSFLHVKSSCLIKNHIIISLLLASALTTHSHSYRMFILLDWLFCSPVYQCFPVFYFLAAFCALTMWSVTQSLYEMRVISN